MTTYLNNDNFTIDNFTISEPYVVDKSPIDPKPIRSKVTYDYGGDSKQTTLKVKTPKMNVPFGYSEQTKDGEESSGYSYNFLLDFRGMEDSEKLKDFHTFCGSVDKKTLATVKAGHKSDPGAWKFNRKLRKKLSKEWIGDNFKRMLRVGKTKDDGDKYPDQVSFKLNKNDAGDFVSFRKYGDGDDTLVDVYVCTPSETAEGKFITTALDAEEIREHGLEKWLNRGASVRLVAKCYKMGNGQHGFGLTWEVESLKIYPSTYTATRRSAFADDSDEDEAEDAGEDVAKPEAVATKPAKAKKATKAKKAKKGKKAKAKKSESDEDDDDVDEDVDEDDEDVDDDVVDDEDEDPTNHTIP